jgi:predicted Fe-Mo cluster-binding NifX family protein
MRIAVPVTDGQIPNHFGHCHSFLIVEAEGREVTSERELVNPRHGPGGPPPRFVASQGVDTVLAWGMPPHAAEVMAQQGIEVVLGATGDARQAVRAWLGGTLQRTTEGLDAGGGCGGHGHGGHQH